MKTVNTTLDTETIIYPQFWTEEWLKIALHELDTRAMSPEKRMHFEMTVSNNAIAIHEINAQINAGEQRGEQRATINLTNIIKQHLKGLEPSEIATSLNLDLDYVVSIIQSFEA
jgi:hypothetical protein